MLLFHYHCRESGGFTNNTLFLSKTKCFGWTYYSLQPRTKHFGFRYNFDLIFNKILQQKNENFVYKIQKYLTGEEKKKNLCSCQTGQWISLKLTSYFHLENISPKVVFYLSSLHKQRKRIKILLGFKVFKMTLESSDISNSLWDSQELTIFFCIWKTDLYDELITGLSEHGTPRPRKPVPHLFLGLSTSASDAFEASITLYCQLESSSQIKFLWLPMHT